MFRNVEKMPRPMARIYMLFTGAMVCLFLVYYFFGFKPLATHLFDIHKERIVFDLDRVGWTFNAVVERHLQLAMQTASRTAIRKKQIAYLEKQISKDELLLFSTAKLADAIHANEEMLGIARYDSSGNFLFHVGEQISTSVVQSCVQRDVSTDQPVVPLAIDVQGQTFLYCSAILDQDYGMVGIDVLMMSDWSVRDVINEHAGPMTVYALASAAGEILYWPASLRASTSLDALKNFLVKKEANGSFIISQVDLPHFDLELYSIVNEKIFSAPIHGQFAALLSVLVVISIVIVVLSIIITRPVVRSLLEEQRMRDLSRRDLLTGLYNRRALNDYFASEVARSRRYGHSLAVVMFDIDHFKKVNDTYGHSVGDEVIQEIGNYCTTISRHNDFWVRYGGEEFLGVLPETDGEAVAIYAERLRSGLEQITIETRQGAVSITVSGGFASFNLADNQQLEAREMIDGVDQALYQAKRRGRNRMVRYEPRHDG